MGVTAPVLLGNDARRHIHIDFWQNNFSGY